MNLTGKTVQWFCANDDGVKTSLLIYPTGNKGNNICVPLATDNTDYQAILEWEKIDGNTIEEAD